MFFLTTKAVSRSDSSTQKKKKKNQKRRWTSKRSRLQNYFFGNNIGFLRGVIKEHTSFKLSQRPFQRILALPFLR